MIGEKKAQTALHGLGTKQNGKDRQNLKGKTEYGLYMIKWADLLRTADHFPKSDLTKCHMLTGRRRTTIFEMKSK